MTTIVCITTEPLWRAAQEAGVYARSTIHSTLRDVGFIHCTLPDQTIEISQRFRDERQVVLLLVNADKVSPPIKYERPKSGRSGEFPHIYGPLNLDAVYEVVPLPRTADGSFVAPLELLRAAK